MKKLVCEMCRSNDIIKQEGLFVCQHCGVKYPLEEARKMMVEGTVRVDSVGNVENLMKLAMSAQSSGNSQEAEQFSNRILEIDPSNYKAWLIKGRAAGLLGTIPNLRFSEFLDCFAKAVNNAPTDETEGVKGIILPEMLELSRRLYIMCWKNFDAAATVENANYIAAYLTSAKEKGITLISECGGSHIDYVDTIVQKLQSDIATLCEDMVARTSFQTSTLEAAIKVEKSYACVAVLKAVVAFAEGISGINTDIVIECHKSIIAIIKSLVASSTFEDRYLGIDHIGVFTAPLLNAEQQQAGINDIMLSHQKIKELDPLYVIPGRPPIAPPPRMKNDTCYVATAVYGSYDCPQVWTLRRYRDYSLARSCGGRAFISSYYAISPKIVMLFGREKWFNTFFKKRLDKLVDKLNQRGFSDAPYSDVLDTPPGHDNDILSLILPFEIRDNK